ncbi:peptidoglycan editing factor PgeF [Desulfatiglans anilini]|uniref:peptidoglycan editing factor PgeF n=1 Tax=Desulfatiglans anilini TaxID=90728 RepID=UPI000552619B|nr:peptidoglycan editing factor PgeF [Desulfatiglans anilini]
MISQIPLFLRFPGLSRQPGLSHAVFTRRGGESSPPYDTLNVSESVGDAGGCVRGNLERIRRHLGAERLFWMNQCHGDTVAVIRPEEAALADTVPDADALVTDAPGLAVMVKQADCQGVVLFDPERRVTAVAHSGWRGSVRNILGCTVSVMEQVFGCIPRDIRAGVGPSLGPCCAEFKSFREIFPRSFNAFRVGEAHFDLWGLSIHQLMAAGLRRERIETAGICTRCRKDLFFSYRGEGATGRFATVAMLKRP